MYKRGIPAPPRHPERVSQVRPKPRPLLSDRCGAESRAAPSEGQPRGRGRPFGRLPHANTTCWPAPGSDQAPHRTRPTLDSLREPVQYPVEFIVASRTATRSLATYRTSPHVSDRRCPIPCGGIQALASSCFAACHSMPSTHRTIRLASSTASWWSSSVTGLVCPGYRVTAAYRVRVAASNISAGTSTASHEPGCCARGSTTPADRRAGIAQAAS